VSRAKTAEPIEMQFGFRTLLGPMNHALDGGPNRPMRRRNFRGKDMPGHARRHSAVSCAKMAEPIEMPFVLCTRIGPRKHVLGVKYCYHWRLSVCLSVRQHISGTTRAIFTNFCACYLWPCMHDPPPARVTKSQGEGAILGFSSLLTMYCNAFAANNVNQQQNGPFHHCQGVIGMHSAGEALCAYAWQRNMYLRKIGFSRIQPWFHVKMKLF